MTKTISLRIDPETEKQIQDLKKHIAKQLGYKKIVTQTDVILIAIDKMWQKIMSNKLDSS